MTKKEFLSKLEKKLQFISDQERNDILLEYGSYIDDKMANGSSEEQAVAGFGDVDELAKEILEAYHINTNSFESKTDKTLDRAFEQTEKFVKVIGHLGLNQFAHLIFDAIVLMILLWIGRWITVDVVCNIFLGLLFSLIDINTSGIQDVLLTFFKLAYGLFALYFLFVILKRRYKRYKNQEVQPGIMEDVNQTWQGSLSDEQPASLYHERRDGQSWSMIFVKIILLIIALPLICITLSGIALFIVFLALCAIYKTFSFGIFLMGLSGVGICVALLWLILYFWPKGRESHA